MAETQRTDTDIAAEAERLWQFALAIYEMEGVKQACLSIQARYGLSISLLLGAIWTGAEGYGRFGATELESSIRRAMEFHRDVIEPLRALRRRLRQDPPKGVEAETHALRKNLLDQELTAERIEQHLFLEDFSAEGRPAPESERWRDAAVNAALLTRKSCPRPEQEALDALSLILQATFPDIPTASLTAAAKSVWRLGE